MFWAGNEVGKEGFRQTLKRYLFRDRKIEGKGRGASRIKMERQYIIYTFNQFFGDFAKYCTPTDVILLSLI